uniref:Uncharacterized protein n=1 Tax=Anguilla anguilla TaxID=7936 RepID=A0A0E9VZH4_ANGAN
MLLIQMLILARRSVV